MIFETLNLSTLFIVSGANMFYSVANVNGDSAKMILSGASKTIDTISLTVGDNQRKGRNYIFFRIS